MELLTENLKSTPRCSQGYANKDIIFNQGQLILQHFIMLTTVSLLVRWKCNKGEGNVLKSFGLQSWTSAQGISGSKRQLPSWLPQQIAHCRRKFTSNCRRKFILISRAASYNTWNTLIKTIIIIIPYHHHNYHHISLSSLHIINTFILIIIINIIIVINTAIVILLSYYFIIISLSYFSWYATCSSKMTLPFLALHSYS